MSRSGVVLTVGLLALGGCATTASDDIATRPVVSPGGSMPVRLDGPVTDTGFVDLTRSGSAPRFELELQDDAYLPSFARVAPEAEVNVQVRNRGAHRHTFTVEGTSVDQVVEPGQGFGIKVTVGAGQVVVFSCRIHGAQGMRGAFYTDEDSGTDRVVPATAPATDDVSEGY